MPIQKPNTEIATTLGFIHKGGGIKPLLEDIPLLDTYVAGIYYYVNMDTFESEISIGDHLELFRETQNQHDLRAILIKHNGEKIGYVPRKNNEILANLMDGGKILYGKIATIVKGDYNTLEIGITIYLKE